MKRMLLVALALGLMPLFIKSEMRYNPVNGLLYSHPESPEINKVEYLLLLAACVQIENNVKAANGSKIVSNKELYNQCVFYLKSIGTPTALRLISDMKKNGVYYANGSYMRKLYD